MMRRRPLSVSKWRSIVMRCVGSITIVAAVYYPTTTTARAYGCGAVDAQDGATAALVLRNSVPGLPLIGERPSREASARVWLVLCLPDLRCRDVLSVPVAEPIGVQWRGRQLAVYVSDSDEVQRRSTSVNYGLSIIQEPVDRMWGRGGEKVLVFDIAHCIIVGTAPPDA